MRHQRTGNRTGNRTAERGGRPHPGRSRAGRPRTGRPRAGRPARLAAVAAPLAAALALTGCGISDTGPVAAGPPAAGGLTLDPSEVLRVYFLTPQGPWPATRPAPPDAGPQHAVDALLEGPDAAERARGLTTALPADAPPVRAEASADTVDLYLPWQVAELPSTAVSQLVCTAARAPGIPGHGDPTEVVVRVHETGFTGDPWEVVCDETGTATPRGNAPDR